MIELFLPITIGACVIGIAWFLLFKKEHKVNGLPEWMKEENRKQFFEVGYRVMNLEKNYPYAKYKEIGVVSNVVNNCVWVNWGSSVMPTSKESLIIVSLRVTEKEKPVSIVAINKMIEQATSLVEETQGLVEEIKESTTRITQAEQGITVNINRVRENDLKNTKELLKAINRVEKLSKNVATKKKK